MIIFVYLQANRVLQSCMPQMVRKTIARMVFMYSPQEHVAQALNMYPAIFMECVESVK